MASRSLSARTNMNAIPAAHSGTDAVPSRRGSTMMAAGRSAGG